LKTVKEVSKLTGVSVRALHYYDAISLLKPTVLTDAGYRLYDETAQNWAKELQDFFTEHFYTCTPKMLKGLAESYAGGGSMTENIDKVGGTGTGAFAKEVIDTYIQSQ